MVRTFYRLCLSRMKNSQKILKVRCVHNHRNISATFKQGDGAWVEHPFTVFVHSSSPLASTLISKWPQVLSSFQVDIFVGVFYVLWYLYYSSFTPPLACLEFSYLPAVFPHKPTRSREYPEQPTRTFALSHPCPSGHFHTSVHVWKQLIFTWPLAKFEKNPLAIMFYSVVIKCVTWDSDHHNRWCILRSLRVFWSFQLPAWARWPVQRWSSPGRSPSSTHSLLLAPLDPRPSGGSPCWALRRLMALPSSPPVTPSRHTESFAGLFLSHLVSLSFESLNRRHQLFSFAGLSETLSLSFTSIKANITHFWFI